MGKNRITIETREVKTLGCGHAIKEFFRGLIWLVIVVGAPFMLLFLWLFFL